MIDLVIHNNNAQSKDIPGKGCIFMVQFPIKQQKLSVYEMGKHFISAFHKCNSLQHTLSTYKPVASPSCTT